MQINRDLLLGTWFDLTLDSIVPNTAGVLLSLMCKEIEDKDGEEALC